MKKKKLKKIAKIIYSQISSLKRTERPIREKYEYVNFDELVSDKTKSLILGLISYRENVSIHYSDDEFVISTQDITNIKKKFSGNTIYTDENYLEITVTKNEGFSINLSYQKRTHYQDKKMYSDLIDTIKDRVKEINRENFTDIWTKVMQESGIMRDSNLDQLLDDSIE